MSLEGVIVTDNTIVDPGYNIYFTDASSNDIEMLLPQIPGDGLHFYFRNINTADTGFTTIIYADETNPDTIEFGASFEMTWGTYYHFVTLGNNWFLIS
jgi:hypothetical protein